MNEIGMLAQVDDAKRREALALVREGRRYDLGRVLDERVPAFPGRSFRQTLVTTALGGETVPQIVTRGATGAWTPPIALV